MTMMNLIKLHSWTDLLMKNDSKLVVTGSTRLSTIMLNKKYSTILMVHLELQLDAEAKWKRFSCNLFWTNFQTLRNLELSTDQNQIIPRNQRKPKNQRALIKRKKTIKLICRNQRTKKNKISLLKNSWSQLNIKDIKSLLTVIFWSIWI